MLLGHYQRLVLHVPVPPSYGTRDLVLGPDLEHYIASSKGLLAYLGIRTGPVSVSQAMKQRLPIFGRTTKARHRLKQFRSKLFAGKVSPDIALRRLRTVVTPLVTKTIQTGRRRKRRGFVARAHPI